MTLFVPWFRLGRRKGQWVAAPSLVSRDRDEIRKKKEGQQGTGKEAGSMWLHVHSGSEWMQQERRRGGKCVVGKARPCITANKFPL